MAGLISNLIETIEGQTDLFRKVIALSADKREFIIKNDIEGLRKIVKQENDIIPKALKGDKNREKIMADIATVLNKAPGELTFTALAELIEGQPEHAAFLKAAEDFIITITEMKEQNDANKLLIQDALDYIDFNINIIHSSLDAAPVGYGALEDAHEPGSFLDKSN
ncbi:MAG: flagellar protein FlgN [Clostridiales bacterium]|jgi:hypothetical protein|nr:flagellar protein FlgN [Clostridiales bacterium]